MRKVKTLSKKLPIEIFMPPNMLKARVGGRFAGIDMAAIKRAEAALEELSPEFSDWISKDTAALRNSYVAYRKNPDTRSRAHLTQTANHLRKTVENFGFPLISRVAASLCNLLSHLDRSASANLVEAHVNAIQIICKQRNILDPLDPTANLLAEELEKQVMESLSASDA
jgi:RNA processing factor Prp31